MPFRLGTAVALVVIGAGMAQAQQAGAWTEARAARVGSACR